MGSQFPEIRAHNTFWSPLSYILDPPPIHLCRRRLKSFRTTRAWASSRRLHVTSTRRLTFPPAGNRLILSHTSRSSRWRSWRRPRSVSFSETSTRYWRTGCRTATTPGRLPGATASDITSASTSALSRPDELPTAKVTAGWYLCCKPVGKADLGGLGRNWTQLLLKFCHYGLMSITALIKFEVTLLYWLVCAVMSRACQSSCNLSLYQAVISSDMCLG